MAILSFSLVLKLLLVWIGLVWVRRAFWISHLRKSNPPLVPAGTIHELPLHDGSAPKVSVIIPARNEEKNIARCLESLIHQTYANYEILVVDDRSTDQTPDILKKYARVRVVRVEKLPPGWTGKNYAMFTGSKAAHGEWFLFTDADTLHRPESIETALAAAENGIDFLTLTPEVESKTFWEKTVQPLAISSLTLWFHPEKTNDPGNQKIFANGQFILVRKEAYEKVGGNEAVKNEVIEDVELARKIKKEGFVVKFLDGTKLYSTRMYTSLQEIKTGWARIFTHLFDKSVPALLHKIFLFLFFSLLPFAICALQKYFYFTHSIHFNKTLLLLSAGVSGWIVMLRAFGNRMLRTPVLYALLHPLASLVMVWILSVCVWRILLKRPSPWRGQQHY